MDHSMVVQLPPSSSVWPELHALSATCRALLRSAERGARIGRHPGLAQQVVALSEILDGLQASAHLWDIGVTEACERPDLVEPTIGRNWDEQVPVDEWLKGNGGRP